MAGREEDTVKIKDKVEQLKHLPQTFLPNHAK
jgi:hypothetical protein